MENIISTHYAITDAQQNVICGVGETVDDAWAMVVDGVGTFFNAYGDEISAEDAFADQFKVYGATKALVDRVMDYGNIKWSIVRGVLCTPEEAGDVE